MSSTPSPRIESSDSHPPPSPSSSSTSATHCGRRGRRRRRQKRGDLALGGGGGGGGDGWKKAKGKSRPSVRPSVRPSEVERRDAVSQTASTGTAFMGVERENRQMCQETRMIGMQPVGHGHCQDKMVLGRFGCLKTRETYYSASMKQYRWAGAMPFPCRRLMKSNKAEAILACIIVQTCTLHSWPEKFFHVAEVELRPGPGARWNR